MANKKTDLKARLLATFQVEAQERLQALRANLLALDRGLSPTEAGAVAEAAFREMHTLKGAARSVGMLEVETLCQECESLLSRTLRENLPLTRPTLERLHESVDRLARLLTGGDRREDSLRMDRAKLDALLRRIEGLLGNKLVAEERAKEAGALTEVLARVREILGNGSPDLVQALRESEGLARKLLGHLRTDQRAITGTVDSLLEEVRQMRMMPASFILDALRLMAGELARKDGKEVEWVAQGADLEIDRKVLEAIKDPLVHLVRNAIDHGIETPDARAAAGKPPTGLVSVTVEPMEKERVEIRVEDDGRGIDLARIREAAVRKRLIVPEEAQGLTDDRALDLIYRSGLSTSPMITEVSGHGLGLAIVKDQIERLDGSIRVETRPGGGTSVRMLLPATIATFRGLLVRAGGHPFLLPTEAVERAIHIAPEEIDCVEGRQSARWEGSPVPLAPLSRVLGLPNASGTGTGTGGTGSGEAGACPPRTGKIPCVLVKSGERRGAFIVDQVQGDREVLLKELGWPLARLRHVSAAGVLGTGEVVLTLRPSDLLKAIGMAP